MSNYDNTNRGVLFINERKNKSTHPDYTGKVDINGTEFWLSAWINEIRNGKRAGQNMVSFTIGDPVEDGPAKPKTLDTPAGGDVPNYDDDIPF